MKQSEIKSKKLLFNENKELELESKSLTFFPINKPNVFFVSHIFILIFKYSSKNTAL